MGSTIRLSAILLLATIFTFGAMPVANAQRQAYRYSDAQMRALLTRLENKTDRFSDLLPNALDRSRVDGTNREDEVNRWVTDFEYSTDQLKQRFAARTSTVADAEAVLRQGALIDRFMQNRQLDYRTEQAWTGVKTELNRLAATYGVARDWDSRVWPPGSIFTADARMTGTYRLNPARSQSPALMVANATRGLGYQQRQQVTERLVARLTPPETLAIERRGQAVTLASTRSPQVQFDADGALRTERYPNGRMSNVRASLTGDELRVVSNGDRANDFMAIIQPINNGQGLRVTREVYAERLSQPVTVQSDYDRIADVAQWNIYDGSANPAGTVAGSYWVPNGTLLTTRLDRDFSTKTARNGDRFVMTVVAPAEFEGATVEGYLSDVDRGGRITGRSEATFNFDRIRTRQGRSYDFAGLVTGIFPRGGESARVDNEGAVAENDSRTNTTISRTAIGTAVGAIIGAIAGGGKGAAIGAGVGAGAGAGSVYVQGRDDLDLARGTEFSVRASAPAYPQR